MNEYKKVKRILNWSDVYPDLAKQTDDHMVVFSIEHFSGTDRQVADRARTTIGLEPGDRVISQEYMRKMYLCEHSPIRVQTFIIRVENIPYSTAMHFVRHNNGVEPFISTGRDDRIDIETMPTRDRDLLPVTMELHCNSQAMVNISRKRLCSCSHKRTIATWKIIKSIMEEIKPSLAKAMVKDCVYRGWCYEHKSCGFHLVTRFQEDLQDYREGINPKTKFDIVQFKLDRPRVFGSILDFTDTITATLIKEEDLSYHIVYRGKEYSIPKDVILSKKVVGKC